jgi:hypothetical protein
MRNSNARSINREAARGNIEVLIDVPKARKARAGSVRPGQ